MGLFIKICGICSGSDLAQISVLKPDALGFIQWPGSKRFIAPETVGRWETPADIRRVGVFVNPSEDELKLAAEAARLDVLQIHRVSNDWKIGRENFQSLEIWQALNPDEFQPLETGFPADRYLIDSYDPKTIGGTGKTCDWNQAREMVQTLEKPVLLAGGLDPGNVAEAIRLVRPWGVDVSSGVEMEPGRKDIAKVAAFISACRPDA
ncbi:MAG: phosphoribosylanthranilate isomerase, partial [Kiritimatiellales bacterium]|nr:phosphoribosylanthranilate isomerase [Kiritimatiellales bacterium]